VQAPGAWLDTDVELMSWAACLNRHVGGQSSTKQAAAERMEIHDVKDDAEQRGYENLPPVPEKPHSSH
jgi:hypothetical protein